MTSLFQLKTSTLAASLGLGLAQHRDGPHPRHCALVRQNRCGVGR
jgi:hypothetical protein